LSSIECGLARLDVLDSFRRTSCIRNSSIFMNIYDHIIEQHDLCSLTGSSLRYSCFLFRSCSPFFVMITSSINSLNVNNSLYCCSLTSLLMSSMRHSYYLLIRLEGISLTLEVSDLLIVYYFLRGLLLSSLGDGNRTSYLT